MDLYLVSNKGNVKYKGNNKFLGKSSWHYSLEHLHHITGWKYVSQTYHTDQIILFINFAAFPPLFISINIFIAACDEHQFTCMDGRCIPAGVICNGVDDCGDNSDEEGPCGKCANDKRLNCKNISCNQNWKGNPLADHHNYSFVSETDLGN